MNGFAISRSRAAISRPRSASSMSGSFGQRVHAAYERAQVLLDDEVDAVVHERLHRPRAPRPRRARQHVRTSLPVRSGFCSEPESANSLLDDLLVSTNQV